ncbi:MAG: hypothetical protein BGO77_06610 [Caedibacter sp. 37-49]|nr:MAG: hypothetical protein BGO77_06610 [Caedibacter sp. 37-49]
MTHILTLILISLFLPFSTLATPYAEDNNWSGYIGPHTLEKMKTLALQPHLNFEQYTTRESEKFPWLTLKNISCINPKTNEIKEFFITNTYDTRSSQGQFVLYSHDIEPTKICLKNLMEFTDAVPAAAFFLSKISYHYEAKNGCITIDHVCSGNLSGKQGYAQVCLETFLKQFIHLHTHVKYVFADLRTPVTQHYFPKYGFQKGLPMALTPLPIGLDIPYFLAMMRDST